LTQLDSALYSSGQVILPFEKKVRDLIIIEKGSCNLYGFEQSNENKEEMDKLLIAKLPECSWFGDFQILLDLNNSF